VLPTPGKAYRSDQPKYSAAGEIVRPFKKEILIEAIEANIIDFVQRFTMQNGIEKSRISLGNYNLLPKIRLF
jgi:hypothetical protein